MPATGLRASPVHIAVVVGVLVAVAAGLGSYAVVAAESRSEAGRYKVEATIADAPQRVAPYRYHARAEWHRSGRDATATVAVPRTAARGDNLTVWLDSDGVPASAPMTITQAVMAGIGAAVVTLVTAGIAAWALVWVFHRRHRRAGFP
ncbi:hypothetical protein [Nocardia sp. XZ_19_369]|uniref:hypothetical protein n=1 Tax=Nocardia sp. XZ_19_369 TaxID=2769487 RepID=UPI00188E67E2|nr:hypothetical protein [Nocardia sp. XZ_19_369]